MGWIIAVSNQKGGVAKTTTCLSLGSALAIAGRRVLLVDCDPQANLTMGAGVDTDGQTPTLTDLLLGPAPAVSELVRATNLENLRILPAEMDLAIVEKKLYGQDRYENILCEHLRSVRNDYDFILCDCPPSLGVLTLNALTAADLVLVPVACEYYAAKGLNQLLQVLELVRQKTNPHLDHRILITMLDRRNGISCAIRDRLLAAFAGKVLTTQIGVDCKLKECQVDGSPIHAYAPRSRAARQFNELVTELLGILEPARAAQTREAVVQPHDPPGADVPTEPSSTQVDSEDKQVEMANPALALAMEERHVG